MLGINNIWIVIDVLNQAACSSQMNAVVKGISLRGCTFVKKSST